MSEKKICKGCQKDFSTDFELGDDPPLWMWHYCSELCRLQDVREHTGVLLIRIRALIEHNCLTKEGLGEIINSYEEEISLNE